VCCACSYISAVYLLSPLRYLSARTVVHNQERNAISTRLLKRHLSYLILLFVYLLCSLFRFLFYFLCVFLLYLCISTRFVVGHRAVNPAHGLNCITVACLYPVCILSATRQMNVCVCVCVCVSSQDVFNDDYPDQSDCQRQQYSQDVFNDDYPDQSDCQRQQYLLMYLTYASTSFLRSFIRAVCG